MPQKVYICGQIAKSDGSSSYAMRNSDSTCVSLYAMCTSSQQRAKYQTPSGTFTGSQRLANSTFSDVLRLAKHLYFS